MNKKIIIILILLIININDVSAKEEITALRKNNKFIGVQSFITIESSKDKVKIESIAVKGLLSYASLKKDDKYKIIIKYDKNYELIKNSIKIQKYKYDKKYTIYRTINTPLKKLYKYKNIDLRDEILDKKLKEKGYKGIEELDEYYKDYYKCDKLTYKELKKITKGKLTYNKESNYEINKISYDYYYKYILIVKNKDLNIELSLNKKYLNNAFYEYPYDLEVLFYLKKTD